MRRIVICGFVWLQDIFLRYPINGTIFEKEKKLLNIKCVFWFSVQLLSEIFLILSRIQRDVVINVLYIGVREKFPLFLSSFN